MEIGGFELSTKLWSIHLRCAGGPHDGRINHCVFVVWREALFLRALSSDCWITSNYSRLMAREDGKFFLSTELLTFSK